MHVFFNLLQCKKISLTLRMQTETQKPGPGSSGKGCKDINRKRLLSALSWRSETSQLSEIFVKDAANSRCPVDMYILLMKGMGMPFIGMYTHITREASANLLVLRRWAMRRPRNVRAGKSTDSHAFFVYIRGLSGSGATRFQSSR